ncbi:MAG: hypothetical protein H7Z17_08245 [Fuerstia sp.]|nr:hypothetical protein [Fuerstiella sp.]
MRNGYWMVSLAIAAFGAAGCEDADYQDYNKAPLSETKEHVHDHAHDHGEAGKHGGHVLEMDDAHAHHAELLFGAASRDITVYFYGAEVGAAKAASNVTLELHVGDGHKDLAAKPMPLDGETDETASRWVISGDDVPADIKGEEQLDGHLEATMDGKPFSYELKPHSHDHDEHAHAEGEHAESAHADEHGDHADHEKTDVKAK